MVAGTTKNQNQKLSTGRVYHKTPEAQAQEA